MTIEYQVGDLFEQGFPAIGHGVNCKGVMGAGIALQMSMRFPGMHPAYRKECQAGNLRPGGLFAWGKDPVVYNMATQFWPGANAKIEYIRSSLELVLEDALTYNISEVGIPRIGAGIGGLTWESVRSTIETVAGGSPVKIIVVTLEKDL